jgi:sulfatase maturation enzyme AslB (radical SAM superfamily)
VVAQAARNVFHSVGINFNRWRGREFVPRSDKSLRIETSSTCNLKCRFCAYEKKTSPKIVMKDEFFRDCVRQGLDMGFQGFDLTPCTGDVFMDRRVFDKLEFLENEPRVAGFFFFTNFTIPDAEDIKRLVSLKKFFGMNISVYGHDLPTFKAITKSTGKVYDRLVANLNVLFTQMDRRAFGLEFSVKSIRSAPRAPVSEVLKALDRFRRAGIRVRTSTGLYNNWGGAVTKDDLRGLDMDIKGEELVYKKGACERLFNTVQIMATGIVNGCACRDAEATLRIGDLHEQPLRDILSTKNTTYMELIDEQQRGEFKPVCQSCDFYKSIYRPSAGRNAEHFCSIAEFKARMDAMSLTGV